MNIKILILFVASINNGQQLNLKI